ncbi:perlucin-like [Culex quinquefasciatus]|uniref:perlucin-like n=1 Tax=Culex quinquefasciatus TaxID=7176 RepID=UPI0018E3E57C|nr:perlucin-like [Culex quinquefasciatus]
MIFKVCIIFVVFPLVYCTTKVPDATQLDEQVESSTAFYEVGSTTEFYNVTEVELREAEARRVGIDVEALSALAYGSPTPVNKTFYLRYRRATFWQAAQFCIDEDKRLASIDSEKQSDQLLLQLKYSSDGFYMAGTDLGREGSWIWINSNRRIVQPNWAVGQPDNVGSIENCLQINGAGSASWNDVDCNMINFYICEDNPKLPPLYQ